MKLRGWRLHSGAIGNKMKWCEMREEGFDLIAGPGVNDCTIHTYFRFSGERLETSVLSKRMTTTTTPTITLVLLVS